MRSRSRQALRNPWRLVPTSALSVIVLIGFMIMVRGGDVGSVVVGLGAVMVSIAIGIPFVRSGVVFDGEAMLIRHGWSTIRLAKREVSGVKVHGDRHEVAQYLTKYPIILTSSGEQVDLSFLAQFGFGRRARRRLQQYVDAIEGWLSE